MRKPFREIYEGAMYKYNKGKQLKVSGKARERVRERRKIIRNWQVRRKKERIRHVKTRGEGGRSALVCYMHFDGNVFSFKYKYIEH